MRKLVLIITMAAVLVSCAPWVKTEGLYETKYFSIELPDGWMRFNAARDYLLATRDGVLLQNIYIKRMKVDAELQHTKKKLTQEMLPQEAAEVFIDNMSSNPSMLNLEVLENAPATVSGLSGFKLVYRFKNRDGLRKKSTFYGVMSGEWFYEISYNAAARYYYDKYSNAFQKAFGTFRLTGS